MESLEAIGNYTVLAKLGEGSFGQIFLGEKDGKQYAIKTPITIVKPMLANEYTIFKQLALEVLRGEGQLQPPKGFGFPQVYQYEERQYFSFMVMEKLDTTLQDLANLQMDNKFAKDVLLLVMYNTLKCLQSLHHIGYLYRDVKPSNFMVRQKDLQGAGGRIYLIDLGLCKKYTRNQHAQHIKFRDNKKLVGTPIFCSLHTHKGLENSRRDDLESQMYMIIYLVKKLPWEDFSLRKSCSQEQQSI